MTKEGISIGLMAIVARVMAATMTMVAIMVVVRSCRNLTMEEIASIGLVEDIIDVSVVGGVELLWPVSTVFVESKNKT